MQLAGDDLQKILNALLNAFPAESGSFAIVVASAGVDGIKFANYQHPYYPLRVQTLLADVLGQYGLTKLLKASVRAAPNNPELAEIASFVEQYYAILPGFLSGGAEEKDHFLRNAEAKLFRSFSFHNVVEWLGTLDRHRRRICRIEPQPRMSGTQGYGTGFLVGPEVILTANHIASGIPGRSPGFWDHPELARGVKVRFDCYYRSDGQTTCGKEYDLAADFKVLRDPGLDFALLKLDSTKGKPGEEQVEGIARGHVELVAHSFEHDNTLLIFQHPDAEPMKLALGPLAEEGSLPADRIAYLVETLPGSSGSPCLTEDLKVCALHVAGEKNKANYGVPMSSILACCNRPENKRKFEALVFGLSPDQPGILTPPSREPVPDGSPPKEESVLPPESLAPPASPDPSHRANGASTAPRTPISPSVPTMVVFYYHPERRAKLADLRRWCQSSSEESAFPKKKADVTVANELDEAIERVRENPEGTLLLLDGFPAEPPQLAECLEGRARPRPFHVIYNEPEWQAPAVNRASASMYESVRAVTTRETLYPTLRKALLAVGTKQWVLPRLLETEGDLQSWFELRYRVWTEMTYLAPKKVCPQTPWELDYTDRTSIHFGLFSKSGGTLVGGGRLVRGYGEENVALVQMVGEMLRKRDAKTLLDNFAYPNTMAHPFDILGELQGFQAYYRSLVCARTSKAELSRIVVDPEYRKHGLGEVIVDSLCSLARSLEIQRLFLACHKKHEEFYGRSGFQAVGGIAGDKFLTYNVPCIAMECTLAGSPALASAC